MLVALSVSHGMLSSDPESRSWTLCLPWSFLARLGFAPGIDHSMLGRLNSRIPVWQCWTGLSDSIDPGAC